MKKAMIFAAGLGTRLRPLTNYKPKALVEIGEMPLLEIAIRRLIQFGVTDIIINIHHFGNQIIAFLEKRNYFDINIQISDESEKILETGGGLKKAAWFFDDGAPFFIYNTDILSNIDLHKLYEAHQQNGGIATLAVRKRDTSRYLVFDKNKLLHGWINTNLGDLIIKRKESENLELWSFSGIHVVSPELFKWMPDKDAFSIIDVYLEAAAKEKIYAFPHKKDFWMDVGRPRNLEEAQSLVSKMAFYNKEY